MTITAKYAGRCLRCGGPIEPGDLIDWDRTARKTEHADCSVAAGRTKPEVHVDLQAAVTVMPGLFSVTFGAERLTLEVTDHGFSEDDGRKIFRAECGGGYRRGFAHLEPDGSVRFWKKAPAEFGPAYARAERALQTLLGAGREDLISWGRAYAKESGACWVCNHPLTDEESMERGIGPVCARRLGLL